MSSRTGARLVTPTEDGGLIDRSLPVVLEALPDAMVAVDLDGAIRLVNTQAEDLFGYSRDELLGASVDTLVPDRVRSMHPGHRRDYTEDPRVRPMGAGLALTAIRKDGTEVPVDISLSPLPVDEPELVLAAVRDMTGRVSVEARFQGLLESAPDAIVVTDQDGIIRLVNRQTEALFGYERRELLGASLDLLVPDRVRDAHPSHRRKYMEDPRVRPMGAGLELTAVRKDGTEVPVDISLSPLETEEGTLVHAAIRDITERRDSERERRLLQTQLAQSQRLESLGQLAGGVAHDFNNLLVVILNYADFLAAGLDDDDHLSQDVAEIRQAAERAAALTHQLLIFGRRELVNPEVLDLNRVVSELERILTRTIGEHIELDTDLSRDLPAVRADRTGMEQVLMNLVVNARDAMPNGGRLSLATSRVTVVDETPKDVDAGDYVRLTVSDTGVGMGSDVAARAFEPFFTTKPQGEGTGLGLATVYGVVTQAGGTVRVHSEPDQGTEVEVYLPPVQAAVVDDRASGADRDEGRGEAVLVVEDEGQVLAMAHRILVDGGYSVLTAASAHEALELVEDHDGPVDLLLTDVVMPVLSGPDLAERLSSRHPEMEVLFMSGYPRDMMPDVTQIGVGLVEKPFTARDLRAAVRQALDADRSRRVPGGS